MVDAAVQVLDQPEKEEAAKVLEEVENLRLKVQLNSVALKLKTIPSGCINDVLVGRQLLDLGHK